MNLILPIVSSVLLVATVNGLDFSHYFAPRNSIKATGINRCKPTEPFQCPGGGRGQEKMCIAISYLCDGARDCIDGYDEDRRLCTAANRPPVKETAHFLESLLSNHGPNYLEKLFGKKAREALKPLGGVDAVSVAISESPTIDDFGKVLHLMSNDIEHLRMILEAVEHGQSGLLRSFGIKETEMNDVRFFLDKLIKTGFLKDEHSIPDSQDEHSIL